MTHAEIEKEIRSGKYSREPGWIPRPFTLDHARWANSQGDAVSSSFLQELAHSHYGVQMRVEKALSDDLLRSDFGDITFDEIPMPAKSMEFFFEDPTLPTIVLTKVSARELQKCLPGLLLLDPKAPDNSNPNRMRVVARIDQVKLHKDHEPIRMVLNLDATYWERVVIGHENVAMATASALEPMEDAVMREMLALAVKVCAYATLPRWKPGATVPITRAMGGKIGFNGRPSRPVTRVVYMPSIHTARNDRAIGSEESEGHLKRAFLGRRGFFMVFRHERYKQMRGKRIFVAPTRKPGVDTNTIINVTKNETAN